jgi:transcriptional regulator with XRE-family HTH domain
LRTRDDPVVVAFAARMQAVRRDRRWSLQDLADRSGISYPALWRLEAGESGPTLAYAVRIASALEVPLAEMVAGPGDDLPAADWLCRGPAAAATSPAGVLHGRVALLAG